jgi:uncharacterized membrane-anchored protein YitT (DUF2179 family)
MRLVRPSFQNFAYSPAWNLFLLTAGALLYTIGTKGVVVVRHGFVTGGVFGTALLLSYTGQALSAAAWYALLNLPLGTVKTGLFRAKERLRAALTVYQEQPV